MDLLLGEGGTCKWKYLIQFLMVCINSFMPAILPTCRLLTLIHKEIVQQIMVAIVILIYALKQMLNIISKINILA